MYADHGRRRDVRATSQQRGCVLYVHDLPRFNGHSSAADVTFDMSQDDPLIAFGGQLVAKGLLGEKDVLKRIEAQGRDFFAHHDLGTVMGRRRRRIVRSILEQVRGEPDPDPRSIFEHIRRAVPDRSPETAPGAGTTNDHATPGRSARRSTS